MALRIWHQSTTEIDGLGPYKQALIAHARALLDDDATIDVHGLPGGSYHGRSPSDGLSNAYVHHRLLDRVIENAIAAERAGYGAFVIGSFSEPYLRETRSAVDIPVVSLTESALLTGCSLGKLMVLVSNAPSVVWMAKTSIDAHGLQSRVLTVQTIEPPLEEPALAAGYDNPGPVIAAFSAAAERAVAQGADVVIPAEGVLAELLYIHKVRAIAGAPVLDVFGVAWCHAVMMARLWERTGLRVGRRWQYRRDDPELIALLHGART